MIVDTQRGLKLVEVNLRKSVFVNYPYERELVNVDKASWLKNLAAEIKAKSYTPGVCDIAEVPKGKGAVRPGSILPIRDMVAYTSIIDSIFPVIHKEIVWSQGINDFAYNLIQDPTNGLWFKEAYVGWE